MQEDSIIYVELLAFTENFQKFESHLSTSKRIIGNPLIRSHET